MMSKRTQFSSTAGFRVPKLMRYTLALTVGLASFGSDISAQSDATEALKELQGSWRAIEQQTGGKAAPKSVVEKSRLEFKGDEMTWASGGPVDRRSRIKVDPGRTPKEIDITLLDGPQQGVTIRGIYALEAGKLRLCYAPGGARPKEFKTAGGEASELIVLERVKK